MGAKLKIVDLYKILQKAGESDGKKERTIIFKAGVYTSGGGLCSRAWQRVAISVRCGAKWRRGVRAGVPVFLGNPRPAYFGNGILGGKSKSEECGGIF